MTRILFTSTLKVASFLLMIASSIIYLYFLANLTHFTNMPIFNWHSLVGKSNSIKSNHKWNILLYLTFFLQHYIMSSLWFKKLMSSIINSYPVF